jgi:sRNA-binding protein
MQEVNGCSEAKAVKAWIASRGVIKASKSDVERAETINAMMLTPLPILPRHEGDQVLPFALGLWDEICNRAKPETSRTALRKATSSYTHRKSYLYASAQPDAMRHDIEGSPVEPVSAEDRYRAQLAFLALREKYAKLAADNTPV